MPINSTCRVSVDVTADESSVNREHTQQSERANFRHISVYLRSKYDVALRKWLREDNFIGKISFFLISFKDKSIWTMKSIVLCTSNVCTKSEESLFF